MSERPSRGRGFTLPSLAQRDADRAGYNACMADAPQPTPADPYAALSQHLHGDGETEMEHIARDIREGRFPERSERRTAPLLPEEATMPDVFLRTAVGMVPAREDVEDHDQAPCYVRLRDYRALLDRAEHAESEIVRLTADLNGLNAWVPIWQNDGKIWRERAEHAEAEIERLIRWRLDG